MRYYLLHTQKLYVSPAVESKFILSTLVLRYFTVFRFYVTTITITIII